MPYHQAPYTGANRPDPRWGGTMTSTDPLDDKNWGPGKVMCSRKLHFWFPDMFKQKQTGETVRGCRECLDFQLQKRQEEAKKRREVAAAMAAKSGPVSASAAAFAAAADPTSEDDEDEDDYLPPPIPLARRRRRTSAASAPALADAPNTPEQGDEAIEAGPRTVRRTARQNARQAAVQNLFANPSIAFMLRADLDTARYDREREKTGRNTFLEDVERLRGMREPREEDE